MMATSNTAGLPSSKAPEAAPHDRARATAPDMDAAVHELGLRSRGDASPLATFPAPILYAVDALPVLQNRMFSDRLAALNSPVGVMRLAQNRRTGLVSNLAFDPDLMVYDESYQNEQGNSAAFLTHLRETADRLEPHIAGRNVVEIGCGKGLFLQMLAERGHAVTGLDPTYEGSDPRIRKAFFDRDAPLDGDVVVLRHVLEHIADPIGFVHDVGAASNGSGLIYIEVPCLDWIIENRTWFDIFYEHVNYFTKDFFESLFGDVIAIRNCFGGQYIGVLARLSSVRSPRFDRELRVPVDFTATLERWSGAASQGPIAVWGGASKGVIFSLFMTQAGRPPEAVIDINPAKQGRFLARTGLEVISPETAMATLRPGTRIVVANPNYLPEIAGYVGDRFPCFAL